MAKKDFYKTYQESLMHRKYEGTKNSRYSTFNQTHYTAGDEEQFLSFIQEKKPPGKFEIYQNLYSDTFVTGKVNESKLFENVDNLTVIQTFQYIFHKFKKGIYIKIENGELAYFLPFSKSKFINEVPNISVNERWKSFEDLVKYCQKTEKRNFNPKHIGKFNNYWYFNNFLVRYEFPMSEEDSGTMQMKDMFVELCKNKKIPDMEFFVNRRDFPFLKKDLTESYSSLFSENQNLLSYKFDRYIPILSMCVTDEHADLPIPTWDDWSHIEYLASSKYFPKSSIDYSCLTKFNKEFNSKKDCLIFRGASTGNGLEIETNPRLKASYLSFKLNRGDIDLGITSWKMRPRMQFNKDRNCCEADTFDVEKFEFPLVNYISLEEQSNYKYILHIQGHSFAYRLTSELAMGSVILMVQSEYSIWYSHLLKENVHYIPIKADLSDLVEKFDWCLQNPEECKRIAASALEFYEKYLNRDFVFNYLQSLLYKLKEKMGEYEPEKVKIFTKERKLLNHFLTNSEFRKELKYKVIGTGKGNKNSSINYGEMEDGRLVIEKIDCGISREKFLYEIATDIFLTSCLSPHISESIPKIYTYDESNNKSVCQYIQGITFAEWLTSSKFNINEYLGILSDLAILLQKLQKSCLFMHNDLYPWNILLNISSSNGKLNPVIIDFDKCSWVDPNCGIFHSRTNKFKFLKINDISILLISSISLIVAKQQLTSASIFKIINLLNFFKGTDFVGGKTFSSLRQVKDFVYVNKKYSILNLIKNKKGLENLTCSDFLRYINSHQNDHFYPSNFEIKPVQKNLLYSYYYIYKRIENGEDIEDIPLSGNFVKKNLNYLNLINFSEIMSIDLELSIHSSNELNKNNEVFIRNKKLFTNLTVLLKDAEILDYVLNFDCKFHKFCLKRGEIEILHGIYEPLEKLNIIDLKYCQSLYKTHNLIMSC
jgi:hypothetical protein